MFGVQPGKINMEPQKKASLEMEKHLHTINFWVLCWFFGGVPTFESLIPGTLNNHF